MLTELNDSDVILSVEGHPTQELFGFTSSLYLLLRPKRVSRTART